MYHLRLEYQHITYLVPILVDCFCSLASFSSFFALLLLQLTHRSLKEKQQQKNYCAHALLPKSH